MPRKPKKKVELTPKSLQELMTEVWSEGQDIRGKSISARNKLKKIADEIIDNPSDDPDNDINKLTQLMKSIKDQEVNERDALKTKLEVIKIQKDFLLAMQNAQAKQANSGSGESMDMLDRNTIKKLMKRAQAAKNKNETK